VAALVLLDSRLPQVYRCNPRTVCGGIKQNMSRRRFLVERVGTRWKVRVEDQEHGPYATQAEAIEAAIDAANRDGPTQADGAQVLVQRLDPTYRILWTFGEDPFPPTETDIAFRLAPSSRGTGGGSHDARRLPSPPPHRGAAG